MECLKSYKGILKRGINCVAFSPDGTKVAALGADDDHCVVINDFNNNTGRGQCEAGHFCVEGSTVIDPDNAIAGYYAPVGSPQ